MRHRSPEQMESNDIFNLENTSDLTNDCKKQLKLLNMRDDAKRLLELFDKKSPLSIDEIIVGLYRLYKLEKTRVWVSSTLYNLSRKNLIKKISGIKGEYEKTPEKF